MNVDETRRQMMDVVENTKAAILVACDSELSSIVLEDCRKEIERLRKVFKRRIDERSKHTRNRQAFPINARAGIERKLEETTRQALDLVNAMSKTIDQQSSD